MDIAFDLVGTYDNDTGVIKIVKQHKGPFTNSISYTCSFAVEDAPANNDSAGAEDTARDPEVTIVGTYKTGKLRLHRLSNAKVGILAGLTNLDVRSACTGAHAVPSCLSPVVLCRVRRLCNGNRQVGT